MNNSSVSKDGIKKGLIASLISAVVLMSLLLSTVNVGATTSAALYGDVSSYAPTWINASSDRQCVLQLKVTLAGATGGIDSINVTFNNVTGFNATTDFMPLKNTTESGVMLYYETTYNGFQGDETRLFFDNPNWLTRLVIGDEPANNSAGPGSYGNNNYYQVNFSSPTGIETTGDKYIYVVVKTNTTAYDGAKFNVSINATNIIGNDATTAPTSDLFSDFTTTIDTVAPGNLAFVYVGNYTTCSNWTSSPYFYFNWTSGGDNGSGVSDYYYKLDTAPTTYNDGTSLGSVVNYTLDISTVNNTDGNHTLYLWAVDSAHNKGNNTLLYLRYDRTGPTLNTITISDTSSGNLTWSDAQSVTLALSATDTASGMGTGAKMNFSNDGTTWSTEETYATSKVWTLASGDGTKTVYFRARDVAGNWNTTGISDTIILDTTAPSVVNNGTTYNNTYGFATYNDTITLWANITDDPSSLGASSVSGILFNETAKSWYVMLNVTLLNDTLPITWVEMKNKTGDPTNFTYTVEVNWTTIRWNQSDGDKWLRINATDNATNSNQSKYILVKVDTSAPVVTNNPTVYPTFTDALGCSVNQTNATNGNTVTFNVTIWDSGSLQYKMVNVTNITTDSYTGISGYPVWLNPPGYVGRWVNLTQGAYINSTTYYYIANVTIGNASYNGTYFLQVNATDYLNNTNVLTTVNVTIDNIQPNVTWSYVDYNISLLPWVPGAGAGITGVYHNATRLWAANGENVTLIVTVQDNGTVTNGSGGIGLVQINVAALNTSQTWVNMTWATGDHYSGTWVAKNITLYGATNGTKALQIKAWDNASNLNSTNYTYVNVSNPPTVTANATGYINATYPWVTAACNGTYVNISVAVSDDDISGVDVFLNDTSIQKNLTYLGAVWANLTRLTGTNTWYNNTINVSAAVDGTYNLTINATDIAGNWNNTQNVSVKVDNKVPWPVNPDVNYINTTGWASNGTKISINITAIDNGTAGVYNVSVDLTNITSPSLGWVDMSKKGSVNSTGWQNWSKENITVTAVTGNYSIWFKSLDNASNLNSTVNTPLLSLNLTVKIDNIVPNVTFAGYSNATSGTYLFCTNLTAANGSANYSVANGDTINLTIHVNDSLSNMLFNSTSNSFYVKVNATPINASLGWVEMNSTSAQAWNFTINITIGETIRDGNYTIFFNITDNATNRNTTTSYPCNITVWVKGSAPIITATGADYPQESPSNTSAATPGHYATINATVFDGSGCNISWTNAIWVDVGLITTGTAGNWTAMSHQASWCQSEYALTFSVNVTVGSAILSGTYNLTVYGVDTGGRSTNNTTSGGRMWWVLVSVDRDNPLVTNPTTEYQNGTSANTSAGNGNGEWVNMSVTLVDTPAGIYNATAYVGEVNLTQTGTFMTTPWYQSNICNNWANLTRNGTSNVYWVNITVNRTAAGDGTHYLQIKVLDNVGHWYNDTYFVIIIRTVGPSVSIEVTLLLGNLASLGTNSTGIIGNNVSVKATTSTDVANVSLDLSAFLNEAGYPLGNNSNVEMSYSGSGIWYYNFTICASNSSSVDNQTGGYSFGVTAYRSGYIGVNSTTAKIDAVRPTSIINQTMSQWWNNTLFNLYSSCIFLNWTHSEAGWWDVTFKVYYKIGSAGTWTEWPLSNTSAMCENFTSILEGETYYFYVVATDYAGNVEASRYVSGSIVEAYNLTTGDVYTTIDTALPSSLSVLINNDDLFNNTGTINVTISGYDSGSGVAGISLSGNGLTWAPWFDFVTPVCNITGAQQYPAIYGNVVIWLDISSKNIYAYNIVNKTLWQITSSGNVYILYPPAIYGNYVVYTNGTAGDYNIYAFNIATGATTAVCINAGDQIFPAIYGTVVVWQGNVSGVPLSYNIYKYDISNPSGGITQLTNSGTAWTPAIYSDYVVYADSRSGNNDTYMYNLVTSTETAVCTAAGDQAYPAIHGNYIVWQDNRGGVNNDTYMYNINTGVETAVCTNSSSQQEYPKIYGDYIVWQDDRYDANYDIYMYTISTGKVSNVTEDITAQARPAIYGSYIVWEDYRLGNYNIYMQQIGASKTMDYLNWVMTSGWGANATDGTKTVYVKIRDWAGNTVLNITDTIIYDTNGPTGLGMVINLNTSTGVGANVTTSRTVTLTLNATDPTNNALYDGVVSNITPGYYLIALRNKTTGTWGAWSAWQLWNGNGTYTYTLSPGDGDRVVEFMIKDRAGNNATATATDSILLNTGAPTVTYAIVGTIWGVSGNDTTGSWYNNTPVRVNLSATDAQNISILWYQVTFDNDTTTGWKNCTTYHTYNWINVSGYSGGAAGVYDANLSFAKEGVHRIDYYALNNLAGTNGSGVLYIRIDLTTPNITFSPNATAGNMNCFNTAVTLTIVINATSSQDPLNATPSDTNWTKFRVWRQGALGTNYNSTGYFNASGGWVNLTADPTLWVNYSGVGLTNLTLIRLLEEGNYTIQVDTIDYAGNHNVTNVTYLNLTNIRIDMTNPILVFLGNGIMNYWAPTNVSGIRYTNSTWVVLRPNACDYGMGPGTNPGASGPWRFQVSNDGVNWYGWNATNVLELGGYVNWTGNGTAYNWNLTSAIWNLSEERNFNLTVYFRIYDNASNYADTSIWIILDRFRPTSTVSVSAVSPGTAVTSDDAIIITGTNATNVPFNITWSGSDDNNSLYGSNITQFIVQCNYSDDGGATWTGWMWNNTVGAAGTSQFSGVDGRVYYFRCNATDRLGWKGDYSTLVKVIVDTTKPTSSADAIATYWHNSTLTITTSTATDPSTGTASGVYSVDLLYKYSSDNSTSWSDWTLFGTDTASPWSWEFTFSSDGYYKFCTRAKDKGYNVETALPADYDTIAGYDTVSPVTGTPTLTGTAGENSWYTTDLSVTLTATDASPSSSGLTINYYVDTGSWKTYTTAFTISSEVTTTEGTHTIYYRTVDTAGNVESTKTKEVKIDLTNPIATSIAINSGDAYTKTETVTLTVSATDGTGSGVATMSFKNEATGTWSDPTTYTTGPIAWSILTGDDGLRTVYFRVKDTAGRISDPVASDTITLDKTAPVTTDDAPAGWQNINVVVTLTATDATSGVGHTYYKKWIMGTTVPTDYTEGATATISADGKWYVKYYSIDVATNAETAKTVEVWRDTTAPTTTDNAPTGWQTTTVTVTLTPTDGTGSGVASTYYKQWLITGTEPGSYTAGTVVTISTDGKWYIKYYSVDTATNAEDPTTNIIEVWRDTTAPTTTDDAPAGWQTTTTVTVTLTPTDAISGVANTYYKKWLSTATEPTSYTAGTTVTITADGKWYVKYYSSDVATNAETAHTVEVWRDITAPTTTDNAPTGWQTSKPVVVTLTATDATSGVAHTYYKKWLTTGTEPTTPTEGTTISISTDGNWYVKYYSVDAATNSETAHTVEVWLDTAAPATTDDAQTGWQTTSPVDITLTPTDATSGVANTYYKKWLSTATEPTSYTAGTSFNISADGKWYIKYYSVDTATNAETPTTKEVWVDTTVPTVTLSKTGTLGENDYYTTAVAITLTASDATSGIASVEYNYTGSWVTYTAPFDITTDGTYTLQYRATDSAGKVSTGTPVTFKIDKTAPIDPSISIEAGAEYSKVTNVTLTLAATGATYMMVSESSAFTGATWETYGTSKTLTLSTTDGLKTVYFKVKDAAGNVAGPISDTITLDTTAPTVSIVGGDTTVKYSDKKVTFTATVSEVVTYAWQIANAAGTTLTTSSDSTVTYDLPDAGDYTVTLTVTDKAGNPATATSVTITVKEKPAPPFIPAFDMISLFAAFGIALTVLALMKKRKH